jgi:hypothetical protein
MGSARRFSINSLIAGIRPPFKSRAGLLVSRAGTGRVPPGAAFQVARQLTAPHRPCSCVNPHSSHTVSATPPRHH